MSQKIIYGVTLTPGTRFMTNSAATVALGCPTSLGLDKISRRNEWLYKCSAPKQKLSIQITDINSVHVNDMNVLETEQREVGENFASQAASTND